MTGEPVSGVKVSIGTRPGQLSGLVEIPAGMDVGGASVVIVPQEVERRKYFYNYRVVPLESGGAFSVRNLSPGRYKAFAIDAKPTGAYLNAQYAKPFEDLGEAIAVSEDSRQTIRLGLMTSE
jgi:hypothetical protein